MKFKTIQNSESAAFETEVQKALDGGYLFRGDPSFVSTTAQQYLGKYVAFMYKGEYNER